MKLKRKILSLVMTAAMITTLFAGLTISASAATVITDLSQITNMSGDYKLADSVTTLNIDASTWTPIGTSSAPFTGTFDGNGKTITWSGTASGQSYFGIFGKSTGTVKNFAAADSFVVTGSNLDYISPVVGYNAGMIDNVTNNASVTASDCYNVGGVAGYNDALTSGSVGVIKNSVNTGAVSGKSKTGGIVGENAGLVSSCNNTGTITSTNGGKDGTGGIAGRNGNNNTAVETGIIRNCYNTGAIIDTNGKWAGGIAGFQNSLSSITNVYNTGTVTAYGSYGYIVGQNEGTITNAYSSLGSGTSTSGKDGKQTDVTDSGFLAMLAVDADGLWGQNTGSAPHLTYQAQETSSSSSSVPVNGTAYLDGTATTNGSGTADSPYNNLDSAVNAVGSGGTVYIKGTVTLDSSTTRHDSVTYKRANGFSGTLFNIATGSSSTYVTLTSMTIDGNGSGTLFDVASGRLRLRGNITLTNCEKAVNVQSGATVEVNKATITPITNGYSVYQMTGGSFIYNDFGDTSIGGTVYLQNTTTTNCNITLSSELTTDMYVVCANPTSGTRIATGTSSTVTATSLGHFKYTGYTLERTTTGTTRYIRIA